MRTIITVLLVFSAVAFGQIPRTISYQGILTDAAGNLLPDGNHLITLKLYDNLNAPTPIFTETQAVPVVKGIFNAIIGSVSPLPASIAFDRAYFLGVIVDGGIEMAPRMPLTAAPYAFRANVAEVAMSIDPNATGFLRSVESTNGSIAITNPAGPVTNLELAANSVGGNEIKSGAVSATKIADGSISSSHIANASVTGAKLAPGSAVRSVNGKTDAVVFTGAGGTTVDAQGDTIIVQSPVDSGVKTVMNLDGKLDIVSPNGPVTAINIAAGVIPDSLPPKGNAGGDLSGRYPFPLIAANAVRTSKIADSAVTSAKLADSAVTMSKLSNAAVTSSKLADSAVTSAKIAAGAVAGNAIADQGVALNKIDLTGASSGEVLNYNGSSVGWRADGMTLPFSAVTKAPGSPFELIDSSAALAGSLVRLDVRDTGATRTALRITTKANGIPAIDASADGGGSAAVLTKSTDRGALTEPVLFAASMQGSKTSAARFQARDTANTKPAVEIEHRGEGVALQVDATGADIATFRRRHVAGPLTAAARIDSSGKGFFNGGTQTGGADIAEAFEVEGERSAYEPGDVLVLSQKRVRTVTHSREPYSTLVAGVYATKPGVLLTELPHDADHSSHVPLGVIGVIPTKVCDENGPIGIGDIVVTSSRAGHAMKGDRDVVHGKPGCIIGKALEPFVGAGAGRIRVLVNVR